MESDNHTHNHSQNSDCKCNISAHQKAGQHASCCSNKDGNIFSLTEKSKLWLGFASLLASFLISYFEISFPLFPFSDPAWIAIVLCATPIFKSAFAALKNEGKITSALLITLAIISSITLQFVTLFATDYHSDHFESYIFAAAEIAWLMALGEMIEELTVKKSRAGITSMLNLAPRKARRITNEGVEEISAEDINVSDTLLVRPNDMIPTDGIIIEGYTSIDQSALTGESLPVDKTIGDEVLAGTYNKSGAIKISASKLSKDTTIAKLVHLVEEAEGKKAPISRVANRWASYIVPSAVFLSVLVFFIAYFLLQIDMLGSFIRAVTILVVFCPCAFTLATPTAIAAAFGNMAKCGVLIKSGGAIEELSKTTLIVFDKTGTLTEGKISVAKTYPIDIDEKYLVLIAASAEKYSEHPIAKSILDYAKGFNLQLKDSQNTKSQIGVGVEALIDGKLIRVAKFVKEKFPLSKASQEFADDAENFGNSIISVEQDGKLLGLITLADTPRQSSKALIDAIKKMGLDTAILSGDSKKSVESIANKLGIKNAYSDLSPIDKKRIVDELKLSHNVSMIGDGVNDAPALSSANSSIAMAALGSDLAIESSDVALLNDDISKLIALYKISKSTLKTIKFNIILSLLISFLAIILSTLGYLTPVTGAIWHNVASVLVVLNSSKLLTKKFELAE